MYQLTPHGSIRRISDNACIPIAYDNSDYAEYQVWIAAGNSPRPIDPPAPTKIIYVSMRQSRLALLGAGLLASVNAAIAAMPGVEGEAARIEWEYATEVRRESSLVVGLSAALGLTGAQMDDLFLSASAL